MFHFKSQMKLKLKILSIVMLVALLASSVGEGNAKYVVVIVWDGMRPDLLTKENTPVLYDMAQKGVVFENYLASFPATTETNVVAIATGAYPGTSGLLANREFRPSLDSLKPIQTQSLTIMRIGDSLTSDKFIKVPTIAEVLRSHKPVIGTACVGTKDSTVLADRAIRDGDSPSIIVSEGDALPVSFSEKLNANLGVFPLVTNKNKTIRDNWTTSALVDEAWAEAIPPFSLLWLGEPDYSVRQTGLGSPDSLVAIGNCDAKLASVVNALNARGILAETDIIILSAYGYSTASRKIDLCGDLWAAKIDAYNSFRGEMPKGSVLACSLGSCNFLYITGHDKVVETSILAALFKLDYVGAVFTKDGAEGTFKLSDAMIDSEDAPDIVVTYKWTDEKNEFGVAGSQPSEFGGSKAMHAGLSPYDMRGMMVAAGPDFKSGFRDDLPTGNVDIAPTVYWIFGVDIPKSVDGRVLSEAMTIPAPEIKSRTTNRLEASIGTPQGTWEQYLKVGEVNGTRYIEEGCGGVVLKNKQASK
jgi:arylsulfatase A-like enzyme